MIKCLTVLYSLIVGPKVKQDGDKLVKTEISTRRNLDEILKILIFHGSHMPGIDLNPLRENQEQFLKTDLLQPTPIQKCLTYLTPHYIAKTPGNETIGTCRNFQT